jgi:hypothetical protein
MYSFQSVEHNGLLELAQTCIDVGAAFGRVDVLDFWYGRKSLHKECELKFHQHIKDIKSIIQSHIDNRTISATTDLWRDDVVQHYYLDFTVFYLTVDWQ